MYRNPCPKCGKKDWIGVEYGYDSPDRYDGVSEWKCQQCEARFGRWTRKELAEGEAEKQYGGTV